VTLQVPLLIVAICVLVLVDGFLGDDAAWITVDAMVLVVIYWGYRPPSAPALAPRRSKDVNGYLICAKPLDDTTTVALADEPDVSHGPLPTRGDRRA
jgi:hypothetical protein